MVIFHRERETESQAEVRDSPKSNRLSLPDLKVDLPQDHRVWSRRVREGDILEGDGSSPVGIEPESSNGSDLWFPVDEFEDSNSCSET